ncbi:hypothetical protein [Streptomyces cucumeris]|uniref:hypothetical protein n=1 Tax=Streptomyces cucumeris TaxID=2962890 RepID=UPI003D70B667
MGRTAATLTPECGRPPSPTGTKTAVPGQGGPTVDGSPPLLWRCHVSRYACCQTEVRLQCWLWPPLQAHCSRTADTFLDTTRWTKGNAWINGFGPVLVPGPQRSLYVPSPVLRAGRKRSSSSNCTPYPAWRRSICAMWHR